MHTIKKSEKISYSLYRKNFIHRNVEKTISSGFICCLESIPEYAFHRIFQFSPKNVCLIQSCFSMLIYASFELLICWHQSKFKTYLLTAFEFFSVWPKNKNTLLSRNAGDEKRSSPSRLHFFLFFYQFNFLKLNFSLLQNKEFYCLKRKTVNSYK